MNYSKYSKPITKEQMPHQLICVMCTPAHRCGGPRLMLVSSPLPCLLSQGFSEPGTFAGWIPAPSFFLSAQHSLPHCL